MMALGPHGMGARLDSAGVLGGSSARQPRWRACWRVWGPRWLVYQLLAVGQGTPLRQAAFARMDATTAGDEFEAFFQRHHHDIFTYAWRLTSDEGTAADLTQETFLRAWQHFGKIRGYERPGGWLFRVATNLALNHLRRRRAPGGAALPLTDRDRVADDPARAVVEDDHIRRSLMALAPRQRAALVLREVYGLSCEEVAATLGIAQGAAKTLLWRARDAFRVSYHDEEGAR